MSDPRDDAPDHAVEALRDLLGHPGFKLLLNHASAEWGASAVVNRCRLDAKAGLTHLLPQEIAVADAIMHMLSWPVDEIGRLEEAKRKAAAKERKADVLVPRRA